LYRRNAFKSILIITGNMSTTMKLMEDNETTITCKLQMLQLETWQECIENNTVSYHICVAAKNWIWDNKLRMERLQTTNRINSTQYTHYGSCFRVSNMQTTDIHVRPIKQYNFHWPWRHFSHLPTISLWKVFLQW